MPKAFRVYEDNKKLLETDDITEARKVQHEAHAKNISSFHEIHRWHENDKHLGKAGYIGVEQLAPFDCPVCGRSKGNCDHPQPVSRKTVTLFPSQSQLSEREMQRALESEMLDSIVNGGIE